MTIISAGNKVTRLKIARQKWITIAEAYKNSNIELKQFKHGIFFSGKGEGLMLFLILKFKSMYLVLTS